MTLQEMIAVIEKDAADDPKKFYREGGSQRALALIAELQLLLLRLHPFVRA
jgi:hypothetical protein